MCHLINIARITTGLMLSSNNITIRSYCISDTKPLRALGQITIEVMMMMVGCVIVLQGDYLQTIYTVITCDQVIRCESAYLSTPYNGLNIAIQCIVCCAVFP